jgi:hypothetical protein
VRACVCACGFAWAGGWKYECASSCVVLHHALRVRARACDCVRAYARVCDCVRVSCIRARRAGGRTGGGRGEEGWTAGVDANQHVHSAEQGEERCNVHPLEADRPRAVDSGLTPRERLQGAGPVPAGPALLCPVRSHIRRAPGPRSHSCAHIRTNRVIGSGLTSSASKLPNIRCSATRSRFCRITKAIRAAAGWGVEPRGSAASVPAEPAGAERRKRMYTLHARSCRAQTVRACTGGNEQGPNGPVWSAPNNERPKHDAATRRSAPAPRRTRATSRRP